MQKFIKIWAENSKLLTLFKRFFSQLEIEISSLSNISEVGGGGGGWGKKKGGNMDFLLEPFRRTSNYKQLIPAMVMTSVP